MVTIPVMTHIPKMESNVLMGTSHQRSSDQTPNNIKIICSKKPSATKTLLKLNPSNRICDCLIMKLASWFNNNKILFN